MSSWEDFTMNTFHFRCGSQRCVWRASTARPFRSSTTTSAEAERSGTSASCCETPGGNTTAWGAPAGAPFTLTVSSHANADGEVFSTLSQPICRSGSALGKSTVGCNPRMRTVSAADAERAVTARATTLRKATVVRRRSGMGRWRRVKT